MEIRDSMAQVQDLLYRSWPKVQDSIDWAQYGTLKRYEPDSGNPKYQDGLLLVYSGDTLRAKFPLGNPAEDRVDVMTPVAERKVILANQTPHGYSAALRDTEKGDWAGGIKVPGSNLCLALTGLPEVADHPFLATVMRRVRLITPQHFELLLDPARAVGMAAALKRISLDQGGFKKLCRELERTL